MDAFEIEIFLQHVLLFCHAGRFPCQHEPSHVGANRLAPLSLLFRPVSDILFYFPCEGTESFRMKCLHFHRLTKAVDLPFLTSLTFSMEDGKMGRPPFLFSSFDLSELDNVRRTPRNFFPLFQHQVPWIKCRFSLSSKTSPNLKKDPSRLLQEFFLPFSFSQLIRVEFFISRLNA